MQAVNRRNLLGFLGVGGAVIVAPVVAAAASTLASQGDAPEIETLTLGDPIPHKNEKRIALAVGKDGKLWVKENGKWRHV